MSKPICIVVGGSWGSESKGNVVAGICKERNVDIVVRTGSLNAGHTTYYNGKPYKMQLLPVGWVNLSTQLFLGPGMYIHLETLRKEIDIVNEATGTDVRDRLRIDFRAGMHTDAHIA